MGLDANLLAIGKFKKNIENYLEYPSHFYEDTQEGATVVTSVFRALTSEQSYELAKAFGIDAWNFNQHEVNPFEVDLEILMLGLEIDSDDAEIEKFFALRNADFKFVYRPNG